MVKPTAVNVCGSHPMTDLLAKLISRLKGHTYEFDPALSASSIVFAALHRVVWLIRGNLKSILLQQRFCTVFVAPGVTWRCARRIRFGRGVTLERGVMLDGLSRKGVQIGDSVKIGAYCIIRASTLAQLGEGVEIGKGSALDAYSFVGAGGGVRIGASVIMGQHVSFHAENHRFDDLDRPIQQQGVTQCGIVIEDDCWVGSNVTFLDGAHVERGCVIAACAVVKGRIPAYSVVAGIPGRVIRSRSERETRPRTASDSLNCP